MKKRTIIRLTAVVLLAIISTITFLIIPKSGSKASKIDIKTLSDAELKQMIINIFHFVSVYRSKRGHPSCALQRIDLRYASYSA